jgi:signal transduction histidine kinase
MRTSTSAARPRIASAVSARLHLFFAILAAGLCVASLLGWIFGIERLTTFVPGRPAMSPMTFAGLSTGALAAAAIPRWLPLALASALAQLLIGTFVVICHAVGWTHQLGIPTFWWSSKFTGLMLVISASACVMLALKKYAVGQVVSFGVLLMAGLMGLAHLFPNASVYKALPGTGVAIPTVLGLAAVSLSQLTACRSSGIAGALSSGSLAGRTGLRLLFAGVGAVLAMSLVVALGYRIDLFDAESAVLLIGWGSVAVLGTTLWSLAVAVARADAARMRAERDLDEQRTMVMAALSHDIRTPLQVASLSAVLLQRLVQGEQALNAVERLQRSHGRIDRMLRSLLDSLTLEGGQPLHLRAGAVSLHELVAEVMAENPSTMDGRVAWEDEAQGWWDRDAVYRVIENLLLNAAKYGRAQTLIWCRIEPRGDLVALTVENEGEPIPESSWDAIFEPFQRGGRASAADPVGWGVGLAYVKAVAARHGGGVRVVQSDGTRTAFELLLLRDCRPLLGGTQAEEASGGRR